jgi:signal transduction histidine kinase
LSTKTKTKIKTKINRLDPNSIKSVSLTYFIIFAAVILLLIWGLQSFFLNNYYESMMVRQSQKTANKLESEYEKGWKEFDRYARDASFENGLFLRVDSGDETYIYDNGSNSNTSSDAYSFEIQTARSHLKSSTLGTVSMTSKNSQSNSKRLVYATYLGSRKDNVILYMIVPLYPVSSTVAILRSQLMYISLIALVIAAMLALFISNRLSAPIEGITRSAMELSRGNYNVKFNGGFFTETKELAKTLNKASYEMQRTDYYQRDLIANVSHDLKTPLTMIKSYAEMIHDISGDNPEKRNEHLEVIISETDRLNKLVSDMLTASRLQSNTAELKKEKFEFVTAASEVVDTFAVLNDQEGYNISFTKCKPTYVVGDRDKLKQVMTNFISNAVKYCGDDKVIIIEVKRVGRKIRMDVIDHGEGIASDEIAHVWERYYRTSANRNRKIEGTGLGLSIVKGILTLHNADYGVESEEGKGSDFWFELETVRK